MGTLRWWATSFGLCWATCGAFAFEANDVIWLERELPVSYVINERGSDDLSMQDLEALFDAAFKVWTDVPCTSFAVEYQGLSPAEPDQDEIHVMTFVEEGWVLDPMALGATMIAPLDILTEPRVTVDVAYNGEYITWRIGGGGADLTTVDPLSVFTHENGHFLGLQHTNDDGSATMAFGYAPDLSQRSLSHDDKWGLCSLYPKDGSTGECDPLNDTCREGSACGQLGEWFFCIEERDGLEAFCNVDRINCQDLCVYTQTDLKRGFCTRVCNADDECEPEGTCEEFGGTKVCRLKPDNGDGQVEPGPDGDTQPANDLVSSQDTQNGTDFGIVTNPADTGTEDTAMIPDTNETPEGPCGCDLIRQDPQTPSSSWMLFALGCVGFLVFRRRRSSDF